ncbi:MAG: D-alanyl-D-alanine carboxypeptidase family protein [Bacteroidetes bacterium]|nr:MAG: D-alanyl-D-alanine carboxypeptidase family protein [Bacteroidota bacterium]
MLLLRLFLIVLLAYGLLGSCSRRPEKEQKEGLTEYASNIDTLPHDWPVPASIPTKYLLGKYEPSQDSLFVKVEPPYGQDNGLGYLHKETYEAFKRMHEAAKSDGISLVIKSPTRNFYRQKEIWEAKWNGSRKVEGQNLSKSVPDPVQRALVILRYSSMPGTSRHHWGTDIDLNAFENDYFKSGQGLKEYNWLQAHAHEYGFCQPYTPKGPERPDGYEEERWHWSYLPLSRPYLEAYSLSITHDSIRGFAGAETAARIDVISKYVMGINPACK